MAIAESITFREIAHFAGYRFGSDGSIWSRWHRSGRGMCHGTRAVLGDWKEKKQPLDRAGYPYVSIKNSVTGKNSRVHAHRLILEAFRGPRPRRMVTRHIDGVKSNNRIENLAYGTGSENYDDTRKHGTSQAGEGHSNVKLDWSKVRIIRRARKRGVPLKILCAMFGVTDSVITNVAKHVTWNSRH